MPHIHLLLFTSGDNKITLPEEVDEYICSRIPALPKMDDTSCEAKQQIRLWHYVTSFMLHDCNDICLQTDNATGKTLCKKHFPKPFSDFTEINGKLYKIINLNTKEGIV